MRTFGVEEEMLLVDATTLRPVPLGEAIVSRHEEHRRRILVHDTPGGVRPAPQPSSSGHHLTIELQQEQIEIVGPPRNTLAEQLEAIRLGRALEDEARTGRPGWRPRRDARLSSRFPTVEVRIADVCMDARHAAVIAALVRALVETTARQWRAGVAPPAVRSMELRAWAWQAAWKGLDESLVSPTSGENHRAGDVVAALLDLVRPVLAEYGEQERVEAVVSQMLRDGTGGRVQRDAYAERENTMDVVDAALQLTHQPDLPSPPASFEEPSAGA